MDGVCGAIMDKIKALGSFGRYFVVSADEFLEEFPEGTERSVTELNKALKALYTGGYIDVKYSSGNMYCVAALKNYEYRKNSAIPQKEVRESGKIEASKRISPFWAAFFGGAAGGILTALISLLFLLC